jgi:nitroreductase
MNRREFFSAAVAGAVAVGLGLEQGAQAAQSAPGSGLGAKTLDQALRARQSSREYAPRELPEALLLRLLWAACGVNRPDSGKRTAPSARNRQEVAVYAARQDGLFLYDARANALQKKLDADLRAHTGVQGYVATAPVNLVYVADMDKASGSAMDEKLVTVGLDAGFISQNVYLFCAVSGLATVARTGIDAAALHAAMRLAKNERIVLAQCVGYPKG